MNQEEQKEKYSAFISDVSEILGLGKPIDILKLCMVTDRFFKPLQNQVKELEAQIEKMKCDVLSLIKDRMNDDIDQNIIERLAEKWELRE